MLAFMVAVSLAEAHAGNLEIIITESGGPPILIGDNGALDTDPTVGVINVDTSPGGGINLLLTDYQFASLRATSNSPSGDVRPLLSVSGTVLRAADVPKSTVTISVSDADFNYVGAIRLLTSASETFENTARGDRYACQSFLDTQNTVFGRSVSGAKLTDSPYDPFLPQDVPISLAQNAWPTRFPAPAVPYSLTAQADITLGKSGTLGEPRSVHFSIVTTVRRP